MSKRGTCWTVGAVTALGVAVGSALVSAERPERQATKAPREVVRDQVPVMVIPAGPHYLTTPAGSSRVLISVPAGFFFEGSGAVNMPADMVGVPVGEKPKRTDGFRWLFGGPNSSNRWTEPYDTVMVQYQDAVLPRIGSTATVDLKLDLVRMRSPDTITVTGTDMTREYLADIEIRPYHQENARTERMGSMSFTRTGLATGKFTALFYAWARFRFTPLDGGTPVVYDLDEQLTITVHDEAPTRFFVPALHDPANTVASEEEAASGGTASMDMAAVGGVCTGGCCCCQVDNPGGHCPAL